MKESIQAFDYAGHIAKQLQDGQVLLSTRAEKFNSMVIGWGHLGVIWNLPTFTVYVRQSRYTLSQLDRTGEFTVSLPVEGRLDKEIFRVCGSKSGRDVDKEKAEPEIIHTPGILEAPLTLECRVLYRQDQALPCIPENLRERFY